MNTINKIGLTGYTIFELLRNIILPSQAFAQGNTNQAQPSNSYTYKLDTESVLLTNPEDIESKLRLSISEFPQYANYNDILGNITNVFSWLEANANKGNTLYLKDAPKNNQTSLEQDLLFAVTPDNKIIPNGCDINYQAFTNAILSLGNIPDGTNNGDGFFFKEMREINGAPSAILSIYNHNEPSRALYTRFEHLMGFLKLKPENANDEKIMKDIIVTYAALPENGYNIKLDPKNIRIIPKQNYGYTSIEDIVYRDDNGNTIIRDANGKNIPRSLVARRSGHENMPNGKKLDFQKGHLLINVKKNTVIGLYLKYVPRDAVLGQDILQINRGIDQLTAAQADTLSGLPDLEYLLQNNFQSKLSTNLGLAVGFEVFNDKDTNPYMSISTNSRELMIALSAGLDWKNLDVKSKLEYLSREGNYVDEKTGKHIGRFGGSDIDIEVSPRYIIPFTRSDNTLGLALIGDYSGTFENYDMNYDGVATNMGTEITNHKLGFGGGLALKYGSVKAIAGFEKIVGNMNKKDSQHGVSTEETNASISGQVYLLDVFSPKFHLKAAIEESKWDPSKGFTNEFNRKNLSLEGDAAVYTSGNNSVRLGVEIESAITHITGRQEKLNTNVYRGTIGYTRRF